MAQPICLDLPVLYETSDDGGYVVVCPAIAGCYSQGDTLEEAEANIRECILLCIGDAESGDHAPDSTHAG